MDSKRERVGDGEESFLLCFVCLFNPICTIPNLKKMQFGLLRILQMQKISALGKNNIPK